ncbi:MAG: ATP-binding cassette domain-containing protein [Pseudomonadota bacterium]
MIKLIDLKKTYSDFVLDIPLLKLEKAKVYALLGHNGSGKSTLLKLIALLENKDQGDIYYQENKLNKESYFETRKKIHIVAEDPFLFSTSVYKNLSAGLWCHRIEKKIWKNEINKVLKIVKLEDFEKRNANTLSRGERQRIAIARALLLEPEVLLLDEPFANIDKNSMHSLGVLIEDLKNTYNMCIVFSTHDFIQAHCLADNIFTMVNGKIFDSDPENIFHGLSMQENGKKIFRIGELSYIDLGNKNVNSSLVSLYPEKIYINNKDENRIFDNQFVGIIEKIQLEHEKARLTLNINQDFRLISIMKISEYEKLSLKPNLTVDISFSSKDVKIL